MALNYIKFENVDGYSIFSNHIEDLANYHPGFGKGYRSKLIKKNDYITFLNVSTPHWNLEAKTIMENLKLTALDMEDGLVTKIGQKGIGIPLRHPYVLDTYTIEIKDIGEGVIIVYDRLGWLKVEGVNKQKWQEIQQSKSYTTKEHDGDIYYYDSNKEFDIGNSEVYKTNNVSTFWLWIKQ